MERGVFKIYPSQIHCAAREKRRVLHTFTLCLTKLPEVSVVTVPRREILLMGTLQSMRLCEHRQNQQLYQFSSVQSLSHVQLFATPWTVTHQASLSITSSQSLLKLMSVESVMPSNHLILCCPLLLLPSIYLSIRAFSNESVLHIRWPKYWPLILCQTPGQTQVSCFPPLTLNFYNYIKWD